MLVARALIARSRACPRGPFSGLPARWPVAILSRELLRIQNRTFLTTRYKLGWQAKADPSNSHQKENERFPKSNRMPDATHDVKVEAQVVDGVQDLSKYLVCRIKMPQIGARIAATHSARTFGVKRALVSSVPRLLN